MNQENPQRVAAWASVVLLAGCSTLPLEDYSRAVGKATCERAKTCLLLDTSADCDSPSVWTESRPELVLLAAGEVGYSAERAAACLERIRTLGCSSDVWETDECQAAFPGRRSEGAPCVRGRFNTCGPGLVCSGQTSDQCGSCQRAACDRGHGGVSCAPLFGAGGRCTDRSQCLEWMSCVKLEVFGSFEGNCSEGPRPAPERRVNDLGSQCDEARGFDCRVAGLRCVNVMCEALGAFESACAKDEDCLSSHCLQGACAPPRGNGDACNEFNCGDGFVCQPAADAGFECAPPSLSVSGLLRCE